MVDVRRQGIPLDAEGRKKLLDDSLILRTWDVTLATPELVFRLRQTDPEAFRPHIECLYFSQSETSGRESQQQS